MIMWRFGEILTNMELKEWILRYSMIAWKDNTSNTMACICNMEVSISINGTPKMRQNFRENPNGWLGPYETETLRPPIGDGSAAAP